MEAQLALFTDRDIFQLTDVFFDTGDTFKQRFAKFHKANPHVYNAIVHKALSLKRAGVNHFGIAAIFETLRYDAAMQTGRDNYKLNNNYRAFYSRLIMENIKELDGFFSIREQKSQTSG